jgi:hypothetical protein
VWLDLASAAHAIAAPVGEAEALGVAAGAGYHGQVLGVDSRAGDRKRGHGRAECAHPSAQVGWQDLLQLDEGSHRGLLDPDHRPARGGAKPDRDGDRLLVIDEQRRHRASGAKAVAAGGAR